MSPATTPQSPSPRCVLLALLAASLCLGGCEDPRERATRNSIHQLAYSAGRMDQALARCDERGDLSREHEWLWDKALAGADGWIGLSGESIAARREAGRESFRASDDGACLKVMELASASLVLAKSLKERTAERQLCSLAGCGN